MAGSETFTCQYCGEEFDSKRALSGHENLQCDARDDGSVTDEQAPADGGNDAGSDEVIETDDGTYMYDGKEFDTKEGVELYRKMQD